MACKNISQIQVPSSVMALEIFPAVPESQVQMREWNCMGNASVSQKKKIVRAATTRDYEWIGKHCEVPRYSAKNRRLSAQ
jgi:hypothetical protein